MEGTADIFSAIWALRMGDLHPGIQDPREHDHQGRGRFLLEISQTDRGGWLGMPYTAQEETSGREADSGEKSCGAAVFYFFLQRRRTISNGNAPPEQMCQMSKAKLHL